ncbi:MAG TPA: AI-2E family transporter [Casimicrobiaceae bacterium]|nr:AI-2E family transporter [Casimicrobiaceae bacterium]
MTNPHSLPPHEPQITPIERWITLAVLAVIVVGCYYVIRPFLSALVWAFILCVATWPVFMRVRRLTGGRAGAASMLMTLAIAAVLLAPFVVVGVSLADNARQLIDASRRFIAEGPPDPPAWVGRLPLLGAQLEEYWAGFAHDSARVLEELKNYIDPIRAFAIASGEALLNGILLLALSIFIAFFVYRDGDLMTRRLLSTVERIFGERGRHLANIAVSTTRGVVYGILGTALAQGILAGIGLALAGVPAAPLLGLATFFLSPVPVGPPLIWIPAAIWLFYHGSIGWAIFLVVWGIAVVSSVDNVIKPLIISRGSNLPFILVMLGVFGGVVAFGFIGVFLGPTLIAIGFALLSDWSKEREPPAENVV